MGVFPASEAFQVQIARPKTTICKKDRERVLEGKPREGTLTTGPPSLNFH